MRASVAGLLATFALAGVPTAAPAQSSSPPRAPRPEVRADVLLGDRSAVQVGGGLQVPLGHYVRVGALAAAGVGVGSSSGLRSARADLVARFLLDPFRQNAVGFSAGGGVGARFEPGARVTPLLLLALEVEGRRRSSGWSPALQVGLGGGARIGLVLRRGDAGTR